MKQNQFLTTVFEAISHPFYVINADDYTVRLANSAAFSGQLPQGITCHLLIHGERAPCSEHGQLCPLEEIKRTGQSAVYEHIHFDPQGETRNVEVRAYPIFDEQGNVSHIIESTLDITEQKRKEEALKNSEKQYRELVDNAQVGVWAIDANAVTTFMNPRMAEMLGYTVNEMLGKHLFSFMDERGIEIAKENLARRQKGIKEQHDFELLHVDGRRVYTSMETSPLSDEEGNYIGALAFVADITWQKLAEEEIQSLARFPQENRNPVLRLQFDGRILYANAASEPLLVQWDRRIDEKLPTRWHKIVTKALETGKMQLAEVSSSGRDFLLDFIPVLKAGYVNVYGRDITRRKQMDEELRERTHQLNERVKELNCLFGISKLAADPAIELEQFLQGAVDLIPPSWQYPEVTCARIIQEENHYQTANFQESPWKQQADILIAGEASGLVEVAYLEEKPPCDEGPFLREERELIDTIATQLSTIIEHRRVEERVRVHEIQLAALAERELIGRELHDDLGQVIDYVNIQAQSASARLEKGQEAEAQAILDQLIDIAQEASESVRLHILGMRTISQQAQAGFFASLTQYLEVLYDQYGLDAQVSLPEGWKDSLFTPEVETQLLRIIQEALSNVRKHAGVNSAKLIFTEAADEIQVIIEDDGRGFDPNSVNESGRHFGLAILNERVATASGRLEIRSAPGKGTRIIVTLPQAISQRDTGSGDVERGVRVLLVDDHPLYLEGLRNLLEARGMQVVGQAHDGLEAQELAQKLRPDLILMDMHMPRCNGLEATRAIRSELPEIKIVMLTVAADEQILFEALKSGASGYLLKSLDKAQFFALLGRALQGETVLSPSLASHVLSEMAGGKIEQSPEASETPALTARQVEVLELIAAGKTNKEIASNLHISESTVKYHVGQILDRLHLKSRYELSHYSRQQASLEG